LASIRVTSFSLERNSLAALGSIDGGNGELPSGAGKTGSGCAISRGQVGDLGARAGGNTANCDDAGCSGRYSRDSTGVELPDLAVALGLGVGAEHDGRVLALRCFVTESHVLARASH
jgi:hypothetical protein